MVAMGGGPRNGRRLRAGSMALAVFALGCGSAGGGSSGDGDDHADAAGDGDAGDVDGPLLDFTDRGFAEVAHGDGGEMRAVDASGDGRPDLVLVAANGNGTRALYLDAASDDALTYVGDVWVGPVADASADHRWMFADNDADGRADFVETIRNGDGTKEVYVSLADGDGWSYVGTSYHHASMDGPIDYLPMDLDGDGRTDWLQVGQNGDGSRQLSAARATTGGGRLQGAGNYNTPDHDGGAIYRVANVNGDGTDDFVEISTADDGSKDLYLSLSFQSGFSSAGAPIHVAGTDPVDDWLVVDGDGDGDDDLVAVATAAGKRVLEPLHAERGSLVARAATITSASAAGVTDAAWTVGDVDGDGAADFIEIGEVDGARQVFVTLGTAEGFIQSPARFALDFSEETTAWYALDLNRDGRCDLVSYRYWFDTDHHHGFHILTSR
jgi:hypothetical protein